MSVEVANQRYLYNQRSLDIDPDAESEPDDYKQEVADMKKKPETADSPMGVYYNYVHDLEPVW